jgi:acetylornithine deacetylase/succinyl-diaminopimelate desuccinylase-like protein
VNVKLLIEGEEEIGSPHLAGLLHERTERLAADLIVFSDTMTWSADAPAVCLGVRGLVKARLEIHGPERDIHAGAVSGAAPKPALELARVLSALHDSDGRVAVAGFYDDVREASATEHASITALTADEQQWLDRTRTRSVVGERGRSIGERLYLRPSAEVETLLCGDPVGPSRGAIAAAATADVQLSLVPDQEPAKASDQLRAWAAAQVGADFRWSLTVGELARQAPYTTPADLPALRILADAMAQAWDRPVGHMRNAGSGPAALLAETVGAPVLFFGTGLPEDHWHGPDESVDLEVLFNGAATLALFWTRLADQVIAERR